MKPGGTLRVAVVVPKYGLVGGGERFAAELTERLARNPGCEFHVFANRWGLESGRVVFHKVPQLRFPRFLRPLSFAWFADRMIAAGNFDLVHSHERIPRADVFSLHSVPHRCWVRDVRMKRESLFDRAVISLERRMMSNVGRSWFLPVSSIAAEALRREYPVDPARIRILPPGVELSRFTSPDRDACRAAVRRRYGIGPSEVIALFVGMNFDVKGLDVIILAVAKAKAQRPGAALRLLVVGKGDSARYRSLAASLGIGDAVIFAGLQEGVEAYYLASDLFLLLSKFDTFGMVVLEAMAARLPVIVSANVGAKDLVEEGRSGFILPDGRDAGAAAEKIVLLLDDRRRVAMGEEGLHTAGRHTWERLAEDVARVYEEVIGSRPVPR